MRPGGLLAIWLSGIVARAAAAAVLNCAATECDGFFSWRMAERDRAAGARHLRDRLDRHLVLLHVARQQYRAAGDAEAGPRGRAVDGPFRRLLPGREGPGLAGRDAEEAPLVQMGSRVHRDHRVPPVDADLLRRRRPLSGRS